MSDFTDIKTALAEVLADALTAAAARANPLTDAGVVELLETSESNLRRLIADSARAKIDLPVVWVNATQRRWADPTDVMTPRAAVYQWLKELEAWRQSSAEATAIKSAGGPLADSASPAPAPTSAAR